MCRGTLQWRGEWISDFPASSGGDEFPAPLRDPNNLGRLQLGRGKWPTRKEPIANLESYQIWLKSTQTWKETQTDRSNRRSLAEFLMGTSRFINEVAQHEEAVEVNQEEKKEGFWERKAKCCWDFCQAFGATCQGLRACAACIVCMVTGLGLWWVDLHDFTLTTAKKRQTKKK